MRKKVINSKSWLNIRLSRDLIWLMDVHLSVFSFYVRTFTTECYSKMIGYLLEGWFLQNKLTEQIEIEYIHFSFLQIKHFICISNQKNSFIYVTNIWRFLLSDINSFAIFCTITYSTIVDRNATFSHILFITRLLLLLE